jgi:hypothetical protein
MTFSINTAINNNTYYFHTHIPIFIFSQSLQRTFPKIWLKFMRVARKKSTCWSHFEHSNEQVCEEHSGFVITWLGKSMSTVVFPVEFSKSWASRNIYDERLLGALRAPKYIAYFQLSLQQNSYSDRMFTQPEILLCFFFGQNLLRLL